MNSSSAVETPIDTRKTTCCIVGGGPGLLLIGDAAHIMSPVGGVGINYAIQDAVVAANVLTEPLKGDRLQVSDLAKVQRQRQFPTRVIQTFQTFVQKRIIQTALDPDGTLTPPAFLRLPILRDFPAKLIGFGIRRVGLNEVISHK